MSRAGPDGRRRRRRARPGSGRAADLVLYRAVWVVVAAAAAAGLVGAVVLLRGDPTYLVQPRTRGGTPWGEPAPVGFPWRAVTATVLVGGLAVAGRRAVSDGAAGLRLPAAAGFALFLADAAVFLGTRPAFEAFLVVAWLAVPLLVVVYSEPLSELMAERGPSPPWALWGLGLVILAGPVAWFVLDGR